MEVYGAPELVRSVAVRSWVRGFVGSRVSSLGISKAQVTVAITVALAIAVVAGFCEVLVPGSSVCAPASNQVAAAQRVVAPLGPVASRPRSIVGATGDCSQGERGNPRLHDRHAVGRAWAGVALGMVQAPGLRVAPDGR